MRAILLYAAILLSCVALASGQKWLRDPAFLSLLPKPAAPIAATYLFQENFEGTNQNAWYLMGAGSGTNRIDLFNTTNALQGAQSAYIDATNFVYAYATNFTPADTIFLHWRMVVVGSSASGINFNLSRITVKDEYMFTIVNSGGMHVKIFNGDTNVMGASTIISGVTNYCWGEYRRDTDGGAPSGISRIWISPTPFIPPNVECEVTNGNSVNQPTAVDFQCNNTDAVRVDYIKLSPTMIGSNP